MVIIKNEDQKRWRKLPIERRMTRPGTTGHTTKRSSALYGREGGFFRIHRRTLPNSAIPPPPLYYGTFREKRERRSNTYREREREREEGCDNSKTDPPFPSPRNLAPTAAHTEKEKEWEPGVLERHAPSSTFYDLFVT